MKWTFSLAVCMSLISSMVLGQQQPELQFSAASILPAAILQTDNYRIADRVVVHEHQFQFNIETTYGTFPVTGIPMLEKRLSELRAIQQASKLSNQPVVA